jgi:hypothetical protein
MLTDSLCHRCWVAVLNEAQLSMDHLEKEKQTTPPKCSQKDLRNNTFTKFSKMTCIDVSDYIENGKQSFGEIVVLCVISVTSRSELTEIRM